MKKYILILYDITSFKISKDDKNDNQNLCKIALIDTESDEKAIDVPVLTYKLDSLDLMNQEQINELLSKENLQCIVLAKDNEQPDRVDLSKNFIDLTEQPVKAPKFSLTPKQRKVMELLAEGLLYKEIATRLNLSYHTVKNHVSNVYDKMEVNNAGKAIDRYLWYKKLVN